MYEAIQQTSGYVVRAVPDDAKFPIIMFDESGEPAYSALPYGSEIELDSGEASLLSTLMMVIRVFLLP